VAALRILQADHRRPLPRGACYFDDMAGDFDWAYNEFTGELLAIEEFNPAHEQVFVAHLFTHPDYGKPISKLTQLPLAEG
jgi:hypothetical protein